MWGSEGFISDIIGIISITVVRTLPFLAVIALELRSPNIRDVFSDESEEHFENEGLYITGNWEQVLSGSIESRQTVVDVAKKIQEEAGIDFEQIRDDSEDIAGYATDASRATRRVWVTSISVLAISVTALVDYVPRARWVLLMGVILTLIIIATTWFFVVEWVKRPIINNYPGDYLNKGKPIPVLSRGKKILPVSRRIIYLNIIIVFVLVGSSIVRIIPCFLLS